TQQINRRADSGNRSVAGTRNARSAWPAIRSGFRGQIPQVVPRTNHFLAYNRSRCRRAGRTGTDAEEKDLCRCEEQPKIKEEACRSRLRRGGTKNRCKAGQTGDSGVREKLTKVVWRAVATSIKVNSKCAAIRILGTQTSSPATAPAWFGNGLGSKLSFA